MKNDKLPMPIMFQELLDKTPQTIYAEGAEEDLKVFNAGVATYGEALACIEQGYAHGPLSDRDRELVAAGAVAAIGALVTILSIDLATLLVVTTDPGLVLAAHATMVAHAINEYGQPKSNGTVN
jgi:hypothetical protein